MEAAASMGRVATSAAAWGAAGRVAATDWGCAPNARAQSQTLAAATRAPLETTRKERVQLP
eukprot:4391011-Pleurochrysis_carterae.AAC.1